MLYVYCIVNREGWPPEELVELKGVEGLEVYSGSIGHYGYLYSEIDKAGFTEDQIEELSQDIEWLTKNAAVHEQVIEFAQGSADVIPLRLFTIFLTEASICDMIKRENEKFAQIFSDIQGRREWGLKLFINTDHIAIHAKKHPDFIAMEKKMEESTSGATFFIKKRMEKQLEALKEKMSFDIADEIHQAVLEVAAAGKLNKLLSKQTTGSDKPMILNSVYLVDKGSEKEFKEKIDELIKKFVPSGVEFRFSGPWPNYNFCQL